MFFQMLREFLDAFIKNSKLNMRRTCVGVVPLMFGDQLLFLLFRKHEVSIAQFVQIGNRQSSGKILAL